MCQPRAASRAAMALPATPAPITMACCVAGTMAAQLPDHARAVRNDDPLLAAEPLLDRVIGMIEARCASVLDGLGRR